MQNNADRYGREGTLSRDAVILMPIDALAVLVVISALLHARLVE